MSVFDLVEQIFKVNEETTMSSISYLPSTIGSVQSSIYSLAKAQQDWDVTFNEDKKFRNVQFGKSLSVNVPHQHWEDFSRKFGISKAGKVSLNHLIKEAMEEDTSQMRRDLKPALYMFFEDELFSVVDKQVNLWRASFGFAERYDTKTAVSPDSKEKDVQFLVTKLLKVYGEDKGGMEMLLSAINNKKVLSSFEIFNKFDFLYGTKVLSTYRDINLIYEALVDTNYQFSQSITIDPKHPDVIYEIEDIPNEAIKVVKNVIYPQGSVFNRRFYRNLKTILKDKSE